MTFRSETPEILVRFSDVGERRLSWEVRLGALTRTAMVLAVRQSGAASRREVDVRFAPGSRTEGYVLLGQPPRLSGRFRIAMQAAIQGEQC